MRVRDLIGQLFAAEVSLDAEISVEDANGDTWPEVNVSSGQDESGVEQVVIQVAS